MCSTNKCIAFLTVQQFVDIYMEIYFDTLYNLSHDQLTMLL